MAVINKYGDKESKFEVVLLYSVKWISISHSLRDFIKDLNFFFTLFRCHNS